MKQEQCCLILFPQRKEAEKALASLQGTNLEHAAISIVRKPGQDDETALFIRLPRIGTVVCDGPFSQIVQAQDCQSPFWKEYGDRSVQGPTGLAAALHKIGVPEDWHAVYERALLHNQVLLVAYGNEERMRRLCRSLSGTGACEPMLYLR